MNNSKLLYSLFITAFLCLVLESTFVPYEIVDYYFQLFPYDCLEQLSNHSCSNTNYQKDLQYILFGINE